MMRVCTAGSSLPSSILTVNISLAAWTGSAVGATSSPHVLRLVSENTTSLSVEWNPPSVTHPEDQLRYRVYYRPVSNMSQPNINSSLQYKETDLITFTLGDLEPDTEYELSVTALTSTVTTSSDQEYWLTVIYLKFGGDHTVESERSEILQTWTEPLIPPFVQIRLVKV